MSSQERIQILESVFEQNKNSENGNRMAAYMKNHFPFFGIPSPKRKEIQKSWILNIPKNLTSSQRWELMYALWEKEEREFQYVAIDWLNPRISWCCL